MNNYLLAIGWWNFVGSLMMFTMIFQPIGKKILNEWCLLFKPEFVLDYWGKLWFFWACGLNVFFGLINIMAVKWGHNDVNIFLIWTDIISYCIFTCLAIWGLKSGKMGSGVYTAFVIFAVWITWGVWSVI